MAKHKIVLTYPIFPEIFNEVFSNQAEKIIATTTKNLKSSLKNADALITLLSDPVNEKLLSSSKNLKVVGNYAVGINNIDLRACAKRGIGVVNTPDVLTRATAELALALLL